MKIVQVVWVDGFGDELVGEILVNNENQRGVLVFYE